MSTNGIHCHEFRISILDSVNRKYTNGDMPAQDYHVKVDYLQERLIGMFRAMLWDQNSITEENVSIFGSILFNVLFDDNTKKIFLSVYDKEQHRKVRLVLEFSNEAGELATWPWEYVYFPDDVEDGGRGKGFFLGADKKLVLTRQVPLEYAKADESGKTNILIIASRPTKDGDKELTTVVVEEVIEQLEKLKEGREDVTIKVVNKPNKRMLVDLLKEGKKKKEPIHIVHFIGHGKYESSDSRKSNKGAGYLAFTKEDDSSHAVWINDSAFSQIFEGYEPRLIFLHACEGAASDSFDAFRGMALKLVFSRIPAVIAMQYPIKNGAANQFSKCFYESMIEGCEVDVAVQNGRMELGVYALQGQIFANRDFGSPVIYTKRHRPTAVSSSVGTLDAQISKILKCPYCKFEIEAKQKVCLHCKHRLGKCPECNEVMDMDERTCCYCGHTLDNVRERDIGITRQVVRKTSEVFSKTRKPKDSNQGGTRGLKSEL